jgi:beta-glucosidase
VIIKGFDDESFRWMLGIEDTSVYPPPDSGMANLDEFELTGHSALWRDDLLAVSRLGATGLRYGVNWPLVHLAPGVFDWSVLDERLNFAVNDLGLLVIADMVHYGTPTWLDGSFADPRYPEVVAEFCGAFAARYRGLVDHITPLNEPLTTASFCGLRGVWPPALEGWEGWTRVTLGIAAGIRRSIDAIRAANPEAVIVHVEASSLYESPHEHLAAEVLHLSDLALLPTDLLLGRVDGEHPMREWLIDYGAPVAVLDGFLVDPPRIDLLGVNYYPDLTPRVLRALGEEVHQHTTNGWTVGLRSVIEHLAQHYGLPMVITETSIEGDESVRQSWLEDSTATVRELRREGVDLRGYTWWPLMDFVDWSFASNGRNVEEFVLDPATTSGAASERFAVVTDSVTPFLRRMGLLSLNESATGTLLRMDTAAAAAYQREADR